MRLALLSLAALCLASCTTVVTLDYRERGGVSDDAPAAIAVDSFLDQRGLKPHYLGTVGVIGVEKLAPVPMEHVVLSTPIAQAVEQTFEQALANRGHLTARNAQYRISGEVIDLHCELIRSPYASAHLRIRVSDASGRTVYQTDSKAKRQSVFFLRGTRDPVPAMREVTSRALQDAVDQVLDSAPFRAAVGL
jgi:hypothetical protein